MIKKILSVLLAVLLVAGILSACGIGKQKLIGKWYDEDGRCLDLRKNGTWQMDGLYGSGTWKRLDDDYIELTDFYGEIDEGELCEDANGSYIHYYGRDFYKGEYPDAEQEYQFSQDQYGETDIQVEPSINVLSVYSSISEGNKITFEMDGTTYYGRVNSKGQIVYYTDNSLVAGTYAGNGACCFFSETGDKSIITLVSEDGQQFELDGNTIDDVIGYGDGLILVYKNNSTIDAVEHTYGVLDCNTGEWVTPLTVGRELYTGWGKYQHIGEGIFVMATYTGGREQFYLFNSYTNEVFKFDYCSLASDIVKNGVIWVKADNKWDSPELYTPDVSNYKSDNATIMPSYFIFFPDGTYQEVATIAATKAPYGSLYIDTTGENMCIKDVFSDFEKEYTAFPSSRITSVQFDGEYVLMFLSGADKKKYFTVIDKDCNTKIEPTVCQEATLSEGMIVYKNGDGIYEVQDVNGNKLVSEEQGYTYISAYLDGIAAAKNSNGPCFIGLDGKPLTLTLK